MTASTMRDRPARDEAATAAPRACERVETTVIVIEACDGSHAGASYDDDDAAQQLAAGFEALCQASAAYTAAIRASFAAIAATAAAATAAAGATATSAAVQMQATRRRAAAYWRRVRAVLTPTPALTTWRQEIDPDLCDLADLRYGGGDARDARDAQREAALIRLARHIAATWRVKPEEKPALRRLVLAEAFAYQQRPQADAALLRAAWVKEVLIRPALLNAARADWHATPLSRHWLRRAPRGWVEQVRARPVAGRGVDYQPTAADLPIGPFLRWLRATAITAARRELHERTDGVDMGAPTDTRSNGGHAQILGAATIRAAHASMDVLLLLEEREAAEERAALLAAACDDAHLSAGALALLDAVRTAGGDYHEAARLLGKQPGTVHTAWHRLRGKLRPALARRLDAADAVAPRM